MLAFIALGVVSCKHEKTEQEKSYDEITAKETELYKDKTEAIDKDRAIEMVRLYVSYVDSYPEDSLAAEYLFRAAEISENANQPNNAVTYLTRIEERSISRTLPSRTAMLKVIFSLVPKYIR